MVQLPAVELQERVDAQRRVVSQGTPDSVLEMVPQVLPSPTNMLHM